MNSRNLRLFLSVLVVIIFFNGRCISTDRRPNQVVFTLNEIASMNQFLSTQSYYRLVSLEKKKLSASRSCSLSEGFVLSVRFDFTRRLITRLAHFDINSLEINIKTYLVDRGIVESQRIAPVIGFIQHTTNLTDSNDHNHSCLPDKHEIVVCYEPLLNETSNMTSRTRRLNSISFLMKEHNESFSYMVCFKLFSSFDREFYFLTENMCLNELVSYGQRDKELKTQFRYKPLFIVLMYTICLSLLVIIALGHHILARSKTRKVLIVKHLKRKACIRSKLASAHIAITAADHIKQLLEKRSLIKSSSSSSLSSSSSSSASSYSSDSINSLFNHEASIQSAQFKCFHETSV